MINGIDGRPSSYVSQPSFLPFMLEPEEQAPI